jgi:predicted flap endonuclease-1-like 5' DNA nuclease
MSILVFCLFTALIGYLLGKNQMQQSIEHLEAKMSSFQFDKNQKDIQSDSQSNKIIKLNRQIEDLRSQRLSTDSEIQTLKQSIKNSLQTEQNLSEEIQGLKKNIEKYQSIIKQEQSLNSEALHWKNRYVQTNKTYQNLLEELETERKNKKALVDQRDLKIQELEDRILQESEENKYSPEEQQDLNNKLVDLKLKLKRQDNIIKALRIQLTNINIEKASENQKYIKEDDDEFDEEKGLIIRDANELEDENSFKEILSESFSFGSSPDEAMEFKEEKVRKTGESTLNFTNIQRKVNAQTSAQGLKRSKNKPGNPPSSSTNLLLIFNLDQDDVSALHTIGIDSFEQLASLNENEIQEIEQKLAIEPGRIRDEKWIDQAKLLISEDNINSIFLQTRRSKNSADKSEKKQEKNSLLQIKGIGKTYEKRLKKLGILTIEDLAKWDNSNIKELADRLKVKASLIKSQQWLNQAQNLLSNSNN